MRWKVDKAHIKFILWLIKHSLLMFQWSWFQKDITLPLHNSSFIHKVKKAILTKFLWIICLYELDLSNSLTQYIQFATTSYMYLQNDRDRFSNWLCWLLYHMWIVDTYHELLLREGKKAILYSTCHVSACSLLPLLLLTRPLEQDGTRLLFPPTKFDRNTRHSALQRSRNPKKLCRNLANPIIF